jgi:hypothetical protein
MSERTCGNCRWWLRASVSDDRGVCRRSPPHPIQGGGISPATNEKFWCGEWAIPLVKLSESMDDLRAETAANANHDAAPAAKAAASDWGTRREELGTGDTAWTSHEAYMADVERRIREQRADAERLKEIGKPVSPQPVAYCIQCEPGDPKVHSLAWRRGDLEKIVTRHGGKIVGLYLREQAS